MSPIDKDNTAKFFKEAEKLVDSNLKKATLMVEKTAKELCAVDTGTLRRSITHKFPKKHEALVGSNVKYARYVELGTPNWPSGKPFLRPALKANMKAIRKLLKK